MRSVAMRSATTPVRVLSHRTRAGLDNPTLSIFDPVYVGIDEFGHRVQVPIIYRNILIGGEPGAGKSSLLHNFLAHAALSGDCRLCLLDGKQVELGVWRAVADVFVGPNMTRALATLVRLQTVMDNRYAFLVGEQRRKMATTDSFAAILLAIDEIAYFSTIAGDKKTQDQFSSLVRDLVRSEERRVGKECR